MQVRYQDKKFNKDNSWDVKVKANCKYIMHEWRLNFLIIST